MTIKWRGRTRRGDVPGYPYFVDTATNIAADPSTTQVGPTATIVPPTTSMAPGDLVVVHCYYRGTNTNWTVSTTGGQQWDVAAKHTGTNNTVQVFFCQWNGSWAANPVFSIGSGTETMIAVMSVYRSPDRSLRWGVDQFVLNSGAGTGFTIASVTPKSKDTVAIACVASSDDNSYGLTATTWNQLGLAQYRSSGGTDSSMALAYKTQGPPTATGPLTLTQTALGADAGITLVVVFNSGVDPQIGAISGEVRSPQYGGPKGRLRGSPRTFTDTPAVTGNVTLALTGAEVTTSAGTLTASVSGADLTLALTGEAVTVSAGTLSDAISVALSGQSVAGQAGTVLAASARALTGEAVTAAAGTLTASLAYTAALTGQSVASQTGSVSPSVTVALAGQAVTASAGSLGASVGGDLTLPLTGQPVAASAGTLGVTVSRALTGEVVTATAGTVVSLAEYTRALTGQPVTASAGTLTAASSVALTGQSVASSTGTLSPSGNVTVALTGISVAIVAGVLGTTGGELIEGQAPDWIQRHRRRHRR